jgi:hypothetical protein
VAEDQERFPDWLLSDLRYRHPAQAEQVLESTRADARKHNVPLIDLISPYARSAMGGTIAAMLNLMSPEGRERALRDGARPR